MLVDGEQVDAEQVDAEQNDDRLVVHYSISFREPARTSGLTRQLDVSLTTLRAANPGVDVVVFCHGRPPELLRTVCTRHAARLAERTDPVLRLRDQMGALGAVLGRFGPVHKFLNFGELARSAPRHALYLDVDTVVFGDLTHLIPTSREPSVLARGEVGSSRCPFGAAPDYLDEDLLATTASAHGIRSAPAFNTGVVLFERFPWHHAARIERRYLAWVVRFAIWMTDHPADPRRPQYADVFDVDELRRLLAGPAGRGMRRLAVPYPSVNRWLVEEAAAWVALGAEPAVRFDRFPRELVAQGGEPLDGPLPAIVWHYFSSNQGGMERRVGLQSTRPMSSE